MERGKIMANIEVRLSTGSAVSTNVDSPNNSLGGKMAETASGSAKAIIEEGSFLMNSIWDNITQLDNVAGEPDYRCIYIYNNATGPKSGPIIGTKFYISGTTYARFQAGAVDQKNKDAGVIRNEKEEPLGVLMESHTKDSPIVLGTLNPGDFYAIWLKRTPVNVSGAGEIRESFDFVIKGSE